MFDNKGESMDENILDSLKKQSYDVLEFSELSERVKSKGLYDFCFFSATDKEIKTMGSLLQSYDIVYLAQDIYILILKNREELTLDRCAKEAFYLEQDYLKLMNQYNELSRENESLRFYKKACELKDNHIRNIEALLAKSEENLKLTRNHVDNLENLVTTKLYYKLKRK